MYGFLRFSISFHLVDDTLSVYEITVPNSGIQGGKFLERKRIPKADDAAQGQTVTKFLTSEDLFIGAKIRIFGRVFELLEADSLTLRCMEANKSRYPVANFDAIIAKVGNIVYISVTDLK